MGLEDTWLIQTFELKKTARKFSKDKGGYGFLKPTQNLPTASTDKETGSVVAQNIQLTDVTDIGADQVNLGKF